MQKYLLIMLLLLISSCTEDSDGPLISIDGISDEAEAYFNAAVDTMKLYSINKHTIDWESIASEALETTNYAQSASETYDIIRYVLENIDEVPGFLVEPQYNPGLLKVGRGQLEFPQNSFDVQTNLYAVRITDKIGYIRIPYYTEDNEPVEDYAFIVRDLIKSVDTKSVVAWIVDLRGCFSGSLWQMVAGVGPIIGNGLAGKFIDADNNELSWYVESGKVRVDEYIAFEYEEPYELFNPDPYVAILTDSMTASSGEAVAISFIGRNNIRSFGNTTYGYSLARLGYELSDRAVIYFTVYEMADRNGTRYGYKVEPDVRIIGEAKENPTNNDVVVNVAVEWLESNL